MNAHFDSFTHFAKNAIILAQEEMQKLEEQQIQSQHLLLGILRQPKSLSGKILKNFGINYENAFRIAQEIKNPIPIDSQKEQGEINVLSSFAQKSIELATKTAFDLGHSMVDSEHLLHALMSQKNSGAIHILEAMMIKPGQVLDYLNNFFKKQSPDGNIDKQLPGSSKQIESLLDGLQNVLVGIFEERNGGGGQMPSPIHPNESQSNQFDQRTSRKKSSPLIIFVPISQKWHFRENWKK